LGFHILLVEDDVVNGYFLPKGLFMIRQYGTTSKAISGTAVIANIWAMTHNESDYPDPFTFKPERFFNADGTLNDDAAS
jgi:hypothetical protein